VRPTGEPCVRFEGFDLPAYWQQSAAAFQAALPHYPVRLRVHPDIVTHVRAAIGWGRVDQVDDPDADGWVPVALHFQVIDEACAYVFRFGPRVEVVEPDELREMVLERARHVLALHDRK
jgi:predicted DNA-binding transcriptional regulator YafY